VTKFPETPEYLKKFLMFREKEEKGLPRGTDDPGDR
jgi:hypothetical protein